jgi:hypothetical protein
MSKLVIFTENGKNQKLYGSGKDASDWSTNLGLYSAMSNLGLSSVSL